MIASTKGGWRVAWVVVALLSCAGRQRTDAPMVNSLKIEGNHRLSSRAIKQKILTTETSWLPFASKKYFDPMVWESDQRRVERLYEASGDYHAKVVRAEVRQRRNNQVDLVLHVAEDQPVLIERVHIAGLDALPGNERERALDDLPLEPGRPFREGDWEAAKASLRQKLRDQGYAEVEVDGLANVDVGKYQAALELVVRPGVKFRFGEIQVKGTPGGRIESWRVHEQVALALEDEYFSDELIEEAQRRVFAMGVFSTARVRTGTPDRQLARIPVIAEVREGPVHTLRLGGGAGVDQIRNEAHLTGEWTDRDFLGGMRKLETQLVLGWAFIPNVYAVARNQIDEGPRDGPIFRAKVQFEQPRLFTLPSLKFQSLLESERTLEQSYDAIGGRARNGVKWQPYSTLTISPTYQLEVYRLNGPRSASLATAPLVLGCKEDPCTIVVSYLDQSITWDKRDSPLEPRKGHYLTLSLQEGGGPLQGDYNYFRIVPEGRGYVTLGDERWVTLAARLQVGTLLPTSGNPDDSAVITRFTSGGAMSMRGYSLRRLSPMVLAPGPSTSAGTTGPLLTLPIGGNGIVEGNLEARTNLTTSLALAGFADFGTVTRDSLGADTFSSLQWAVGLGLRYLTAVGPIRIDIAYRLPFGRPPPLFDIDGNEITYERTIDGGVRPGREDGSHVNKSCFGIGGSSATTWVRDGLCVFHISIGEAF
jgi:translocation and assembly module TamA